MGYLYILKSKKNGRYYIGSTINLDRRLVEHNAGKTASLRNLLPVELVFSKIYDDLGEARKMELHLKSLKSKNIIERIVRDKEVKTSF
ncbi:MAG: GIY-YIG nuclease family protein [Patescibacteria group bacterium]